YGPIAYVDPNTYDLKEQGENRRYDFDQNHISESGIVMAFGNLQAYSFLLNYHLENPLPKNSDVEITIPPDTAFQKVYIEDINPKPTEIKRDKDGNWLAVFNLGARERVDVVVAGTVELYSAYQRNFSYPGQNLQDYLKETEYWQTSDPEIIRLANELKTPRAIYDYVVNNLNYDYSRVRSNVQRLGAVEALKNPNSAICMEFTDAFIDRKSVV